MQNGYRYAYYLRKFLKRSIKNNRLSIITVTLEVNMKGIAQFLKKNAVYFLIAFSVLAIGLSITFALISGGDDGNVVMEEQKSVYVDDKKSSEKTSEQQPEEKVDPVDSKIVFELPLENFSAVNDYTETIAYNGTLNRYESHKAIDFFAEEGTKVLAVYDGTVESVTNDLLKGYTITIDHGNGLKSVYNSLFDGDTVYSGQKVKKGQIIGEVSTTNRQEYKDGAHLHFAVMENGIAVDPGNYLLMQDK